jgi:flavin-binding protein dodecin
MKKKRDKKTIEAMERAAKSLNALFWINVIYDRWKKER